MTWSLISFLVTDTNFSDEYLFLNSQYSRLCQKTTKNTGKTHCRKVFWQPKFEDTEIQRAAYTTFSKRIQCEINDTRGLFPLLVVEVKIYTACKTLCSASIVDFIAACQLCLDGSAVKIALGHAQSTNSFIATCVDLGL